MKTQRKKLKIYRDEAKERLTTHWDMDYMTTAEIEAVMAGGFRQDKQGAMTVTNKSGGFLGVVKRMFMGR